MTTDTVKWKVIQFRLYDTKYSQVPFLIPNAQNKANQRDLFKLSTTYFREKLYIQF
jgi:hypothetical protein